MTTEEKLRHIAIFLSDRTADASWLLCQNTRELIGMEETLENYGYEPDRSIRDKTIDRMYEHVLKLEIE